MDIILAYNIGDFEFKISSLISLIRPIALCANIPNIPMLMDNMTVKNNKTCNNVLSVLSYQYNIIFISIKAITTIPDNIANDSNANILSIFSSSIMVIEL
uniref:Uncharacterized protein n=1 Tax=Pithovirus LCPAC102 TaxID=2506587 RepID=A0A4D5XFQ8_9VIRU|nr:MAG: hypothetical protein LCPAC102_01500 [Pithovirus LCPAC102]